MTPDEKQRLRKRIRDVAASRPYPSAGSPRLAVYLRLAKPSNGQITSLELITDFYQEKVRRENWTLMGAYVDEGQDHASLEKLLDDCRSGEIDFVVVKAADFESIVRNRRGIRSRIQGDDRNAEHRGY